MNWPVQPQHRRCRSHWWSDEDRDSRSEGHGRHIGPPGAPVPSESTWLPAVIDLNAGQGFLAGTGAGGQAGLRTVNADLEPAPARQLRDNKTRPTPARAGEPRVRSRRSRAYRQPPASPERHRIPLLISLSAIAVGTALSGGPPHRSQRALLTHWAPASGPNVEALAWEGMLNTGRRKPMRGVAVHPFPVHPGALASTP